MLNILAFLLGLVDQHVAWFYVTCLLLILLCVRTYLLAHQSRMNTIFTIEREVATHNEGRAMTNIGSVLVVVIVITAIKYYLIPSIDVQSLVMPTPTITLLIPTNEPTPTISSESATATHTPRPRRTLRPVITVAPPTSTPLPAPQCPDPNVRIASPPMGAVLSGRVVIQGTANHARFQFFKVELAQGAEPASWGVLNRTHLNPVIGGVLEQFDTTTVPNGLYWLQLVVVDQSGNFPPPCQVRVIVRN